MANHKDIIPFIKVAEGGLSRSSADTASKNPSPCVHKGQKGWHTNKGIQWISFKSNASKLGYSASCDNFINMPESVWAKIYKNSYWDAFDLDNLKSQAVANTIVSWAWGSGVSGAYKSLAKFMNEKYGRGYSTSYSPSKARAMITDLNQLTEQEGDSKIFGELVQWRRDYFIGTGQTKNIKGWLSRLDKFERYHDNKLEQIVLKQAEFAKKYWWVIGLAALGVGGLTYALIKYRK